MRKIISIWFLFIVTILSGCSNGHDTNLIEATQQSLTKNQVDEIITAANKSVIVDIDLSQVPKPDPAQQTEINARMRFLGENLKGKVTMENKKIIVARVNEETITAADWYWEKINEMVRATYNQKDIPSDAEVFNDLIETKAISSTARKLGIYPPKEQIEAYIADQERYIKYLQPEEITILLQNWAISEDQYYLLMEDRFTDSLAKINWGVYLDKYDNDTQDKEQGFVAKSPAKIDAAKIKPLLKKAKIEVTPEGRKLGIPLEPQL